MGEITVIASNLLTWARRSAPEAARARAAATISAVALAAAGLAACSGTSAPKADPPTSAPATSAPATSAPATSPAPAGTASSAAPSASTQVSGLDVCALVTPARVAAITKDVIRKTTRGQIGTTATCTYGLTESTIVIQVAAAGSAAAYAGFSTQVTSGAVPAGSAISVPGLGQRAISSSVGVAALTGQDAVLVLNQYGTVANQLSDDVDLARAAISALD
jgi:hypothetical protein